MSAGIEARKDKSIKPKPQMVEPNEMVDHKLKSGIDLPVVPPFEICLMGNVHIIRDSNKKTICVVTRTASGIAGDEDTKNLTAWICNALNKFAEKNV